MKLRYIVLCGLFGNPSAWTVKAADIDNWGLIADNGAGGTGISGPEADAGYQNAGGTSEVQDMTGACVGPCKDGSFLWNIQSILTDAGDHLAMQFAVTDYIASSKQSSWPWANAGYLIAPIDTKAKPQQGVLLNGGPMGLTNTSVLSVKFNYQAGKRLTLQLFAPPKADGSAGFADATYGVPKKELTGTGADQTLNINVTDIKASWGTFPSARYAEAVGVGFFKFVQATVANNATFPVAEAAPSPFKFFCVSNEGKCGISKSPFLTLYDQNLSSTIPTNSTINLGEGPSTHTLRISNTGNDTLRFNGNLTLSGSNFNSFSLSSPNLPAYLAPGHILNFTMSSNAPAGAGYVYANLGIPTSTGTQNFNLQAGSTFSKFYMALDGQRIQPASTAYLGASGSNHRLVIRNDNSYNLNFYANPTISGTNFSLFALSPNTAPSTLNAGDSLVYNLSGPSTSATATLTFSTSTGTHTLDLNSNSGITPTRPIAPDYSLQGMQLINTSAPIQLLDLQGKLQQTLGIGSFNLSQLGLSPGVYFLKSGIHREKFTLTH